MTFFQDTGTLLDASIDEVWTYLASERHGPAHAKSGRNFRVTEEVGSTATIFAERRVNGTWRPFLSRSTAFPPFCICNEEVEGDFAGTKFVLLYTPEGSQTRVDVYGDVRSPIYAPDEALRRFRQLLDGSYEEDVAAMAKKPARRRRR